MAPDTDPTLSRLRLRALTEGPATAAAGCQELGGGPEALALTAYLHWLAAAFDSALSTAERAVTLATDGPQQAETLATVTLCRAVVGPVAPAVLQRAVTAVAALPSPTAWVLYLLAEAAMATGDITVALDAAERAHRCALAEADRGTCPTPDVLVMVAQVRSRAQAFAGQLEQARSTAQEALDLAQLHEMPTVEALMHAQTSFLLAQHGERKHARRAARIALATDVDPATSYLVSGCHTLVAYALAADGALLLAAATLLSGVGPRLERMQFVDRAYGYELLASAALSAGDLAGAQEWLEVALAEPTTGMAAAAVQRTQSLVLAARGELSDGAEAAAQAAREAALVGGRLDSARAQVLRGSALSRLGSRQHAVAELEQVVVDATDLGALQVRAHAVRELRRLGRRVVPSDREAGSLTPRERQIALLVADGLTDRQVARLLHVSERTVQTHVGTVLRRLGLTSRAGVPAALTTRAHPASSVELTPRQEAVTRLVAAGMQNAEVAAALGISVRTVDKHVADACARYAVRSRTALAAAWQGRPTST